MFSTRDIPFLAWMAFSTPPHKVDLKEHGRLLRGIKQDAILRWLALRP